MTIPNIAGETHHRHHGAYQEEHVAIPTTEGSPLMYTRHLSMNDDDSWESPLQKPAKFVSRSVHWLVRLRESLVLLFAGMVTFWCTLLVIFLTLLFIHQQITNTHQQQHTQQQHGDSTLNSGIIPIEQAIEHLLPVDDGSMLIWFRTWGNPHGIPVLFVHGGPGNAIADYGNRNKRFFDYQQFWVIEVDQRGTGKSQPSVRQDWRNMQYYSDISIDQMCQDFEKVREALQIEQWLVWGGSFGSTLTINYATRYAERCTAIIIRGIFLNTPEEVIAGYSRSSFSSHVEQLEQFDIFYNFAKDYALQQGEPTPDPDDARTILRLYERMILSGDEHAIWQWHVFENNLMEEDPKDLLDPAVIDKEVLPEARSIAFFETRLLQHGGFESPANLLDRVEQLTKMPVWICQGRRDKVCPAINAHKLVDALDGVESFYTARFVDAGHEQTDPIMARCLKESLYEFLNEYTSS